jgi:hypothetical protein
MNCEIQLAIYSDKSLSSEAEPEGAEEEEESSAVGLLATAAADSTFWKNCRAEVSTVSSAKSPVPMLATAAD